jgi:hypothetical protein
MIRLIYEKYFNLMDQINHYYFSVFFYLQLK